MKRGRVLKLGLFLLTIMGAIGFALYHSRCEHTFDAERWRDAPAARSHYRVKAVDDLLSRHELRGMSRSDILNLLGQPGSSQKGRAEPQALVYWLGAKGDNFFIDDYWLVIRFNAHDNVNDVLVTTD